LIGISKLRLTAGFSGASGPALASWWRVLARYGVRDSFLLVVRLEGRFNHNPGSLLMVDMSCRSHLGVPKILCVELDVAVLESRCAVLKMSGYDPASASPQLAEIVLRNQKFDLIVLSTLSDYDQHRILDFADGADLLVLDGFTMPAEFLWLVAERLNRVQRRAEAKRGATWPAKD
jgi:hypothetical protein